VLLEAASQTKMLLLA